MKKLLIMVLLMFPLSVMADTTAVAGSLSGAVSGSSAGSVASQGNQQNITFEGSNIPDHVRTVPDVIAPGLVASFTECFGSASAGVAAMGFGISLGKTYTDSDCQRRKDANQAVALGEVAVGYQVMCASVNFFKADQASKKACKVAPDGMAPVVTPLPAEESKQGMSDKPIDPVAFLAQ